MNGNGDLIVGGTPAMQKLYAQLQRVADTTVTVVITGESGTGKELIARELHRLGPRAKLPFVAINCAAIPETLIESELFGHEKGAFTGAAAQRRGLLEVAEGGTVFVDEVGELAPAGQVKLLRFLQEHTITRVGGTRLIKLDVRVVAATHRNLSQLVRQGKFREDLYYRLNVIAFQLPALRERVADIPRLVDHFVAVANRDHGRTVSGATPALMAKLADYPWPGNIRELGNIIERMVVLKGEGQLDIPDLADEITTRTSGFPLSSATGADAERTVALPSDDLTLAAAVEAVERAAIDRALVRTGNNIAAAARLLGISRETAHRKIRDYGL